MFQDGGTGGTGVMTGIHSFVTELAQVDVQFRQTSRELVGKLVVYAVIRRLLVSLETLKNVKKSLAQAYFLCTNW